MMNYKKIVAICFLTALWSLSPLSAHAKTINLDGTCSGSIVSGNFDFDNPAESSPAGINTEGCFSELGESADQAVVEVHPDGNTCFLRSGAIGQEYTLTQGTEVSRNAKSGDLIVWKRVSLIECIDFSSYPNPPFPFEGTVTQTATSGTGDFAGISGSMQAQFSGQILNLDASSKRSFSWFTATFNGSVNLPKAGQ
jgi:hypothetical protein